MFKTPNEVTFDVLLYEDSICFKMERCTIFYEAIEKAFWQPDSLNYRRQFYSKLDKDLSECVKVLHECKIVHRDIKPANFLYS